jgi:membrane protein YqaA with SNARE-associated domain
VLRGLYDRVMLLAASRHAPLWLAVVAFCEGVFFPIPPDVMLMPLVLARRERAWLYAAICLAASVAGGSTGYAVGYFLNGVGLWLLAVTGYGGGSLEAFRAWYAHWGLVLIALPIPYKITAIASGLGRWNFGIFLAASIVIRGIRFFAVAALVRAYGAPIRAFVEKRLVLVVSGAALAVVGALLLLKVLLHAGAH